MAGTFLLLAAAQVLVTVLSPETGMRLSGLTVRDFSAASAVESVSAEDRPVAALLLVDRSVAGEVVRGTAERFIGASGSGDRLALMTFNGGVVLEAGFTDGKAEALAALAKVRYEGDPQMLDGLSAALDARFPAAGFRKVIVLLTAGIEGPSRIAQSAAVQKARERGIAIYPIYLHGSGRWVFDGMARETGGAPFWLRSQGNAERIWETIRRPYLVTLQEAGSGVKVKGREKTFVSTLPLN